MTESSENVELISHGFFKHLPGEPCKVCAKKAAKEAAENPVPESEKVSETFTEEQVVKFLADRTESIRQEAYDIILMAMMDIYEAGTYEGRPYLTMLEINAILQRFGSEKLIKREIR